MLKGLLSDRCGKMCSNIEKRQQILKRSILRGNWGFVHGTISSKQGSFNTDMFTQAAMKRKGRGAQRERAVQTS